MGGTGFFVARRTILTCAHVVYGAEADQVSITVQGGTRFTGRIRSMMPSRPEAVLGTYPYPDLAIIWAEDIGDRESVWLDAIEPTQEDRIHCAGFTETLRKGESSLEPATFTFEGAHHVPDGYLYKLGAGGQAVPGMSGAPLINLRTGRVCGVLKTTRDKANPYGGWGIPISAAKRAFTDLELSNNLFHANNPTWLRTLPRAAPLSPWGSSRLLPPSVERKLVSSESCRTACRAVLLQYQVRAMAASEQEEGGSLGQRSIAERQLTQLLSLVFGNMLEETRELLSARDVLLVVSLCVVVCLGSAAPRGELIQLMAANESLRKSWIEYVSGLSRAKLAGWRAVAGASQEMPDTEALMRLDLSMTGPELLALEIFVERRLPKIISAMSHDLPQRLLAGAGSPFPLLEPLLALLLRTFDRHPREFAEQSTREFSGAAEVGGCRPLFISIAVRCAVQLRRFVQVSEDGGWSPADNKVAHREELRAVQNQLVDVRRHDQAARSLSLIFNARSPRMIEAARSGTHELQTEIDKFVAVLNEYSGNSVFQPQLLYLRIRTNLDDPYKYVASRGFNFEPYVARLEVDGPRVLTLLIRPLYGNRPELGIRELIQNALDAVRARRALPAEGSLSSRDADSDVTISLVSRSESAPEESVPAPDSWNQWIEVRDRGIGMLPDVVRNYFLRVGGSFDAAEIALRIRNSNSDGVQARIGRFGIGILAAFLLGSEVQVLTRNAVAGGPGLTFVMREDLDDVEFFYCSAPAGTSIRVKLDPSTYQKLSSNHDLFGWFHFSEPRISFSFGLGEAWVRLPGIPELDVSNPSTRWRRVDVPGFDGVFWTHSKKSWNGTILVNGMKIQDVHRNFDRFSQLLGPITQLKQPIVSVLDREQRANINLTRDSFVEFPKHFLEPVRRDALVDHFAWLANLAAAGSAQPLVWESHVWKEYQYTGGQGDGVVDCLPYFVSERGIIPLRRGSLSRLRATKLLFVLKDEGRRYAGEDHPDRNLPSSLSAIRELSSTLGTDWFVSVLKVEMFGGFGYSPAVAGISEAFRFVHSRDFGKVLNEYQVVTEVRGRDYRTMYRTSVVDELDGLLRIGGECIDGERAELTRLSWDRIAAMDAYGFLSVFLDQNADYVGESDEFDQLWCSHGLPDILPFGVPVSSYYGPAAEVELKPRIERMRAQGIL